VKTLQIIGVGVPFLDHGPILEWKYDHESSRWLILFMREHQSTPFVVCYWRTGSEWERGIYCDSLQAAVKRFRRCLRMGGHYVPEMD
jgi:hypothetical protein